jgi:hypothetical protein
LVNLSRKCFVLSFMGPSGIRTAVVVHIVFAPLFGCFNLKFDCRKRKQLLLFPLDENDWHWWALLKTRCNMPGERQ